MLLLDEPSNGLDPDGIRWLRTYLGDFARRGGTVFVSSHLIGELDMLADDLVVVGAGKLLAAESVAAITARKDTAVIVDSPQAGELAALLTRHRLTAERTGDRLLVRGTTKTAVSQLAFDHRLRVDGLTDTSQSLEDSLLELTSASAEFARRLMRHPTTHHQRNQLMTTATPTALNPSRPRPRHADQAQ